MTSIEFAAPGLHPGRPRHERAHRRRIKAALAGAYASLERWSNPGLPAQKVVTRALRRASRAYDQLGEPRAGQLLPMNLGRAVLITVPDGGPGI